MRLRSATGGVGSAARHPNLYAGPEHPRSTAALVCLAAAAVLIERWRPSTAPIGLNRRRSCESRRGLH